MEGESQPDNENKKERKNKIKRTMSSCKIIKVNNSASKENNKLRLSESKMNNQISREIFPERDIIIAQTIFIIPNCNGIIGNKKDNIAGIENTVFIIGKLPLLSKFSSKIYYLFRQKVVSLFLYI